MANSKYVLALVMVVGVLASFGIHQRLSRFGPPDSMTREHMELKKLSPPDDGRMIGEAYIHDYGWYHGYAFWNGPYTIHFFTDSGDEYWLGDFQFKVDKVKK